MREVVAKSSKTAKKKREENIFHRLNKQSKNIFKTQQQMKRFISERNCALLKEAALLPYIQIWNETEYYKYYILYI